MAWTGRVVTYYFSRINTQEHRTGMLHIVSGALDTATASLGAGDTVVIDDSSKLQIAVTADAETLWFDLP